MIPRNIPMNKKILNVIILQSQQQDLKVSRYQNFSYNSIFMEFGMPMIYLRQSNMLRLNTNIMKNSYYKYVGQSLKVRSIYKA
ncbi:UNKNOWN [Stylonychia lemnae]|uniref:Uncharacterized protein n=1 Tax=Stylonychia lemnae TaxID=5949 RepID=A0A078AMJ3_STYLE|nr:UNKNOWN [Stylonychia lemnae]|eukprot:CDW82612.1 UNKNOWN [Stylonychia lemnae]